MLRYTEQLKVSEVTVDGENKNFRGDFGLDITDRSQDYLKKYK